MEHIKGTGAYQSEYDPRHFQHPVKATAVLTGGEVYQPSDIEDQWTVGICTAIDLTNMASKFHGKHYSADFNYLMQKRSYDANYTEGSSNLSSLKVGTNIGFLPSALFPVTEEDRKLPYAQYIEKLQSISDATLASLAAQCENKLLGYALVGTDITSMEQAIADSQAGIMCMYLVDNSWWTDINGINSYDPSKIDPIRPYKSVVDGHSIKATYFDQTSKWPLHANSWGTTYDLQGNCHVGYPPVECWIPYFNTGKFVFNNDLHYGDQSIDVKQLQIRLGMPSSQQTGFFGLISITYMVKYQLVNKILPVLVYVGINMRNKLNET